MLPPEVLAKNTLRPKAIPAAHVGYDLSTTGGVRILFRDPDTHAFRQTVCLHSDFHPTDREAFSRTTDNLKVTYAFCETLPPLDGESAVPASGGEGAEESGGGTGGNEGSGGGTGGEAVVEVAESASPQHPPLEHLEAAVVCQKAFVAEDDHNYPNCPAKPGEDA